jgi:hypothetical protein
VVNLSCRGISDKALELSDLHCSIPMKGMVDSFNVSVAAGILMHHAVCDRTSRLVMTVACNTVKKCKLHLFFWKMIHGCYFPLIIIVLFLNKFIFIYIQLKGTQRLMPWPLVFCKASKLKTQCLVQLFDLVKSCNKFIVSKGEAKFSFLPVLNGFMFTYYQSLLELLHCMSF